jgi:phosphomevalonate kinase
LKVRVEAQAPGKLVIVGDYAVLRGAPGIAAAVDVRARARIDVLPGAGSLMVIPGIGNFSFRWVPGTRLHWEGQAPGDFGLPLECSMAVLAARQLLPRAGGLLPACRVELSTEDFHWTDAGGQRQKLGLGSSAAIVVALTGALLRVASGANPDRQELLGICHEAHRLLQGGAGSGIDVATALAGGVLGVEFPAPGQAPRLLPLSWPRSLQLLAVWSGSSASTPAMLNRLRMFEERQPASFTAHMQRLGAMSVRTLAAWRAGDVPNVLQAIGGYDAALRQFDEDAGMGIYTREHERIRGIALEHGAVYKTSGAGGGDFGIALADSRATVRNVQAAVEAAGFRCLNADLCATGLTVASGSGN